MTSTTDVRTRVHLDRRVAAACGAALVLLGVSACGSGAAPASNVSDGTAPGYSRAGPQGQQGGSGQFPGANGKVAAVDGSTAQVQGEQGQVAVTWTRSTTFTKQVAASLADVSVGSCVFVGADSTASGSTTPATKVTASTVRITAKRNGSCGVGTSAPGGGPAGAGDDDGPQLNGTPPSGAPQGGDRPQLRGFGGAVGEVTAVSATGFTVSSARTGSSTKTTVTVTVNGSTAYTTTAKGASSDVKVGVCLQAEGTTDDTGAITAETVEVSPPQDGQCGGFMRMRSSGGDTSQES